MPLNHSHTKKALQEDIKREIAAGKPVAQAVAIGYAATGFSRKKKKK